MKMLFALVAIALVAGSQASTVSYDGYKVYRATPVNDHQIRLLETLDKTNLFDFWSVGKSFYHPWDVMVKPQLQTNFESILLLNKIRYEVFVEDVQKTFYNEVSTGLSRSGRLSFTQYNRYNTISAYVKQVAANNPKVATVLNLGKTTEGRDLLALKISTGGANKPTILVDGGIHAREWLAPATTSYIIQELVENQANRNLIENVDWIIVPVLNPDGYEYTHTNDRMWRKTRTPGKYCDGVDGNRNWGFHWNEIGASDYECDDTYAGPNAFSEPENVLLKNLALQNKDNIKLYLTFHSYGAMLLYPWGFTSDYPDNADELQSLGEAVNDAIEGVRGTSYTIGSSTNVLYPAAGGSDDWMMGVAGIPLAYTIELPSRGGGFQPAAREIKGVVEETFEGIKAYHQYVEGKWA